MAQQRRLAIIVYSWVRKPKAHTKQLVWLSQLPQWVSGAALAFAMLFIIHKFGPL